MTHQVGRVTVAVMVVVGIALGGAARPLAGQTPGAHVPRTPGGQTDLSGIWQAVNTANWNLEAHDSAEGVPGGPGVIEGKEIPYRPEALAQRQKNFTERATTDPETQCFNAGVPRATYMPFPFQIVQGPQLVTILYQYHNMVRLIPTDGSQHTAADVDFWMGDSRGHWEGKTLVVDVTKFNDQTWFDHAGDYHSEALHVVERYTRVGPDHLAYEATIEDPKVFTRPWKISMPLYRRVDKNMQLVEYECAWFTIERFLRANGR